MEMVITLVVGLLVLAPFVVLVLRTTRWDPIEARRRRVLRAPADAVPPARWTGDDRRRADTDLAAAAAHAGAV